MVEPLPGELEDWTEVAPNQWARDGYPESVFLTPPLTFEEYYERRLVQSKMPEPTQPTLGDLMARIEALEKRNGGV